MNETITTPDAMIDDKDSMAFYILRDETVALCKHESQVPYHKKRETYLSCGRYSPLHKKVVFWPGAVNPSRAIRLLVENTYITSDYTWYVSGATTKITGKKVQPKDAFDKYDAIRKSELTTLTNAGMKIQCKKDQK